MKTNNAVDEVAEVSEGLDREPRHYVVLQRNHGNAFTRGLGDAELCRQGKVR